MSRILRSRRSNKQNMFNPSTTSSNYDLPWQDSFVKSDTSSIYATNYPSHNTSNNMSNYSSNQFTYSSSTHQPHYSTHSSSNSIFREITTDKFGNNIVDVSNSAFSNVDQTDLHNIMSINTNTNDPVPFGKERYEDINNYDSEYKHEILKNSVKDVYRQARYLRDNDTSHENREFINQVNSPMYTTETEHKRLEKNILELINHNNNRFD